MEADIVADWNDLKVGERYVVVRLRRGGQNLNDFYDWHVISFD